MKVLPILAAVLLTGCTGLFFYPTRARYLNPEDLGAIYETVRFPTETGESLGGMFFPARRRPALGTVVHFHGNAQNISAHFTFAYWLVNHGFNVFVFDYRGYGSSEGKPGVARAIQDGIAAIRYVGGREDVAADRVVVFAQSLGGAIAIAALARTEAPPVKALAVESSFASSSSVAQDKLGRLWPIWPLQWPLSRLLFSTRWHPQRHIAQLPQMPLLFIHGTADRIVPYREGKRLFALAHEPKEFWSVKNGRHTEAFTRHGAVYRTRLAEFFEKALERGSAPGPRRLRK